MDIFHNIDKQMRANNKSLNKTMRKECNNKAGSQQILHIRSVLKRETVISMFWTRYIQGSNVEPHLQVTERF